MNLTAQNLSRSFRDKTIIHGADLEVRSGEVLGLLGPNGAGKTTILRMLAGILTPSGGRVLLDGVDIRHAPVEARRHIGFLSGDTQLYQRLTPVEVLTFFGRLFELPPTTLKRRVHTLIEELEIGPFLDQNCGTLSSGQKQRVNIARAFLHEPHILILDEPTNALDLVSGRFIVESIRRQRTQGRAVLFSSHIMGEAEYLCDRVALLYDGHIKAAGTLEALLEQAGADNLTDAFLFFTPDAH